MVTGYADQSYAQLTNLEICLLDNGSTAIAIARMLALNVDDPGPWVWGRFDSVNYSRFSKTWVVTSKISLTHKTRRNKIRF